MIDSWKLIKNLTKNGWMTWFWCTVWNVNSFCWKVEKQNTQKEKKFSSSCHCIFGSKTTTSTAFHSWLSLGIS